MTFGCQTAPVPPEVREADIQEEDLWRAGASLYAGQDHAAYLQLLRAARSAFEQENLKLGWLRDYRPARREFRAALDAGSALRSRVEDDKSRRSSQLASSAEAVRRKLQTLDNITLSLVERGEARRQLSRASVLLAEAEVLQVPDCVFRGPSLLVVGERKRLELLGCVGMIPVDRNYLLSRGHPLELVGPC